MVDVYIKWTIDMGSQVVYILKRQSFCNEAQLRTIVSLDL